MLVDTVENYDTQKVEFLKNLREKTIKNISTREDPKKIYSFLGKCGILSIEEKTKEIYIGVPNEFIQSQVKKFFKKELEASIQEVYSDGFKIKIAVYSKFQSGKHKLQINIQKILGTNNKKNTPPENIDKKTKEKLKNFFGILFDQRYKFENFVVGGSNQLAYSASKKISESPGKVYNPFFIYGDVGLGKTHLLQAIGNYIMKTQNEKTIVYLPSTKLIDEIVEAIRKNTLSNLMKKLEQVDVLIIDDIQFLANKEKTQEIFHNIFNDFHINQKQIIISSDRPPKELDLLEARLKSRFALGLVTDVKKPDFETRLAIIHSKLREKGEQLDQSLCETLAKNIQDNIREIEGAINLIMTRKNLLEQEIGEKDIFEALQTLGYNIDKSEQQQVNIINAENKNTKNTKSFGKIVEYVSNYYDIGIFDIKGESRKKEVSMARQMLMYIAKEHFGWTLEKIGDYFGGKNHATVIYAINNFKKLLKNNKQAYNDYQNIIQDFK
ncbi:chromosomal replication initiator protein DnaA [Candidatus Absconditicoccus praedator]|uniref:chromosomal replication initiator protein DnaA n=1 Tax=Candidatus Absconditicoccus praedator TaxID=2735562 RepID=UPI001E41E895|nr:chromosomal replication initiator protein DnaA [Candidatus Absconditicoccus praedator]UFX83447.1 chromosomal replication initiator protein DnaA [Candidatus Absconditicoccus praedator]